MPANPTTFDLARNAVDTWIPNGDGTSDLVTIDLETAWAETFAYWDSRVDSDTAARIATATITALKGDTVNG